MSEQWYCPDCGPITKMREEFLSGGYMCAECEAPARPIPAFVTALQQQIAERDARIATLEAAWILSFGFATGHGDTIEDLLSEAGTQIQELRAAQKEMK